MVKHVVKAMASGANFTMLGRSVMYALGANGKVEWNALLSRLKKNVIHQWDFSVAALQVRSEVIHWHNTSHEGQHSMIKNSKRLWRRTACQGACGKGNRGRVHSVWCFL